MTQRCPYLKRSAYVYTLLQRISTVVSRVARVMTVPRGAVKKGLKLSTGSVRITGFSIVRVARYRIASTRFYLGVHQVRNIATTVYGLYSLAEPRLLTQREGLVQRHTLSCSRGMFGYVIIKQKLPVGVCRKLSARFHSHRAV